jgi:hypothetical protein
MVDTTGTWIEKNVEIKYIICAFYITRYLSDPVLLACWIDTLHIYLSVHPDITVARAGRAS